jgi:hypothetical protein
VQDHRLEFRAAFTTNRVGKIIDTSFYVTLQLPDIVKSLIRRLGREPVSGFDTKDVSEMELRAFAARLADAVNGLI